ncbi:uncharacterized protein LOC111358605 isoform X2 [Spodoptera litura]|uniref:Uncharacterized protein LOC111358605 isoform X2 n=1 Tax=Spodoptera litura TaxID=69820 RepID=A0A9J7EJE5_SPOLT|nr:uncharacterized protein LOC111358605 isoform X2 [Spodoptera litura]
MDSSCAKVFSSNITRVGSDHVNYLYDLLKVQPAIPLKINDVKKTTCDYIPKTDKCYIPKRKSRLKVKTVRDIRKSFEQDTYAYLLTDLETQQNILFKKIRHGSSGDCNTKKMAKSILRGDTPVSKSTWQMLINLNPEDHKYPRQFVLCDGKFIQVNGSFGGNRKTICNYDLANKSLPAQNIKMKFPGDNKVNRKKSLLRNSLTVRFKPGPFCRKKILDTSYQKYHVGNTELLDLPKPGIDIFPTYGIALEPTITNFLNNLRHEDGTITRKWAELAVSVLGTIEKSKAVPLEKNCITFDLAYKYNKKKLLMRRDSEIFLDMSESINKDLQTQETDVEAEIEEMLKKIVDSVEISLVQDSFFVKEDILKPVSCKDMNSIDTLPLVKDKSKRKFGELDRLDVTVITLPETAQRTSSQTCSKMYCGLGCICASLAGSYNIKQHCGRVECMFHCKCDFTYKGDLSCADGSSLFPVLFNIDSEMNLNLAKEEQKFHQTVIVAGEKRILLKGEKRNWKTSKKYADFYSNMSLKHEHQKKRQLTVVALKLNCENIESWCMVHNLYKCFCKGRFVETCASLSSEAVVKESPPMDAISNSVEHLEENLKETSDKDESLVLSTKSEQVNSEKQSKSYYNSLTKHNKVHSLKDLDNSSYDMSIKQKTKYDPLVNKIKYKKVITKNIQTEHESSVPEFVNTQRVMVTRHSIKKTNVKENCLVNKEKQHETSDSESKDSDSWGDQSMTSSRTNAYEGRKYSNGYYKNTNYKILNMEKNDKRLQEKLASIHRKIYGNEPVKPPTTNDDAGILQLLCDPTVNNEEMEPKAKRKRLGNTKLVAWLETNYKLYKKRNDKGLKDCLEAPQQGKVALHSWDFILKRYRERKNLFLVSNVPPYRIFMAVNTRNPFFANCININDIRFADLNKYPQTVKNLLINASDLKDNFCILRGLACCWELIGSVAKVNENSEQKDNENDEISQINIETFNVKSSDMESSKIETFNVIPCCSIETFNLESSNLGSPDMDSFNINSPNTDSCGLGSSNMRSSDIESINLESSSVESFSMDNGSSDSFRVESVETKSTHKESTNKESTNKESTNKESTKKESTTTKSTNTESTNMESLSVCSQVNSGTNNKSLAEKIEHKDISTNGNTLSPLDAGSSKWFVMTIEHDFSEIRFFKKGFFVKYESIINAVNVARLSGKTVRLSSKKFTQTDLPQFGIYAIPNNNEYCVFVGPYEMEDPLGIETIKTILDVRRMKRTRGFWITTNKIDNLKVVENPLSFVPSTNNESNSAMPLETHFQTNDDTKIIQRDDITDAQDSISPNKIETSPSKPGIKIVKPIKIRKTNGFYHLASDGVLKKIALKSFRKNPSSSKAVPVVINIEESNGPSLLKPNLFPNDFNPKPVPETSQGLVSEPISQIKISSVFSTKTHTTTKPERGMFILKPEEINRKLVNNKLMTEMPSREECEIIKATQKYSVSASNTNNISTPSDDVCIISDDEHDSSDPTENCNFWSDIWIECTSVPNLGWIAGIRNSNNMISYKLPDSEFSDFYTEDEAFTRINMELCKRINSPLVDLKWKINESNGKLKGQEINPEHLYPDYVDVQPRNVENSEASKEQRH